MFDLSRALIFHTLAALAVATCACSHQEPSNTADAGPSATAVSQSKRTRRLEKDGWTLAITYVAAGRSEGQDGRLFHGTEEILGNPGEVLDTPLGKVAFYGRNPQAESWQTQGWNCAASQMIKPSYAREQFDSCIPPPPCANGTERDSDRVHCCGSEQDYDWSRDACVAQPPNLANVASSPALSATHLLLVDAGQARR